MKGINFRNWWQAAYSTPDSDLAMANLKATGADWIGIVSIAYMDDENSTKIRSGELTPSDADLAHAIQQAHRLGLSVMLKPQVAFVNPGDMPIIGKSFTPQQWNAWFASYQTFVSGYARLAEANDVELLCVGTELNGTTDQSARWRDIIRHVRRHYGGQLTYSATHSAPGWIGGDASIDWWDALDYIGVSAYYPLTNEDQPTLEQLKDSWRPWVGLLNDLAERWGKQVLLTEIGYRNLIGANRQPWNWVAGGEPDLDGQSLAYEAAFESLWDQPWFAGSFWWEWGTNPEQGAPEDTGFTPYNRPAGEVLRSWYAD